MSPVAEGERANVWIDRDLWKAIKIVAAQEEKTIGEVIDGILSEHLKSRMPQQSRGS